MNTYVLIDPQQCQSAKQKWLRTLTKEQQQYWAPVSYIPSAKGAQPLMPKQQAIAQRAYELAWEGKDSALLKLMEKQPWLAKMGNLKEGGRKVEPLVVLALDHCCFKSGWWMLGQGADVLWRNDIDSVLGALMQGIGVLKGHRLTDQWDLVQLDQERGQYVQKLLEQYGEVVLCDPLVLREIVPLSMGLANPSAQHRYERSVGVHLKALKQQETVSFETPMGGAQAVWGERRMAHFEYIKVRTYLEQHDPQGTQAYEVIEQLMQRVDDPISARAQLGVWAGALKRTKSGGDKRWLTLINAWQEQQKLDTACVGGVLTQGGSKKAVRL